VPAALEQQAEFPDIVQVLFVAPAQTMAELQAFGDEQGGFEAKAMWTNEAPLQPSARYPAFALLCPDGRVLMEGSATVQEQEIRECLLGFLPALGPRVLG